jgi:hypothetical protein
MKQFDARYQEHKDGALTREIRDRITKFRMAGSTLADIGREIGFSSAFVGQLLNEKSPARVRSIHVPRIIKALEAAERDTESGAGEHSADLAASNLSLEELIQAITAKGFVVTISSRAR